MPSTTPAGRQSLTVLDTDARTRATLSDTISASGALWEPEGIVYEQSVNVLQPGLKTNREPREIRAIDPNGSSPYVLFSSERSIRLIAVVRP